MVLVHGTSAHSGWWHHTVPALAADYDVLAFDLSGHGDSGRRSRYSMATWADEVLAVVEHLCGGRALVVGHSVGGLVAAAAATRGPEAVSALVLVDAMVTVPAATGGSVPPADRPVRVYPTLEAAAARFRLEPPQPVGDRDVLEYVAARSLREVPGGWAWKVDPLIWSVVASPGPLVAELAGVQCPAAVIRGELSSLVGPDAGARLTARWGRDVPQVTVPAAHHHVMVDRPGPFADALRAVLDRLSDGAAPGTPAG